MVGWVGAGESRVILLTKKFALHFVDDPHISKKGHLTPPPSPVINPGAVLENSATLAGGWSRFFLNNIMFLGENSSTFDSVTKIVPRLELSYVP